LRHRRAKITAHRRRIVHAVVPRTALLTALLDEVVAFLKRRHRQENHRSLDLGAVLNTKPFLISHRGRPIHLGDLVEAGGEVWREPPTHVEGRSKQFVLLLSSSTSLELERIGADFSNSTQELIPGTDSKNFMCLVMGDLPRESHLNVDRTPF